MTASSSEHTLRAIFAKLGHSLEEIRVRSLENILSKLEHGLVSDVDLIQEKQLHVRLLEWFNFASCPMQEQALALILRLSKHPSAARIYLDIGSVDFLTKLRPNVESSLHTLIDDILDQLFHLPSTLPAEDGRCVYWRHSLADVPVIPDHLTQPSQQSLAGFNSSEQTASDDYSSHSDAHAGYFGTQPADTTQSAYAVQSAVTSSKFLAFPWVVLTPTDRHVLSSTDTSLNGSDASLVISACEFLSDVVFQDFPAEVFIQRPTIVKSLLSLLTLNSTDKRSICIHALTTLTDLSRSLENRIHFYQDPALHAPRQGISGGSSSSSVSFLSQSVASSDTRPSVIGQSAMRHRGDGEDNSSNSHMVCEETDAVLSLQLAQWSTPQYCSELLARVLPVAKTTDERVLLHAFQLLHQVSALLGQSVDSAALWDDCSTSARQLVQKFSDCFEMLSDLIYLHYHGNLSASLPSDSVRAHVVAFTGLALFLQQLLTTILPFDKVSVGLPSEVLPVLTLVADDPTLALSYPEASRCLLSFLKQLDMAAWNRHEAAERIADSMQQTCSLLQLTVDDANMLSLLCLAEGAVDSLFYHGSVQLVNSCVQLVSYICKKTSPNPAAVKRSRQLLLSLLAHCQTSVRRLTYHECLQIVQDALGIDKVAEPTSVSSLAAVFLMDRHILYEIISFGLTDGEEQVKKSAEQILIYLLQCQLLVPSTRWQQLMEELVAVLSTLQGLVVWDTTLCSCMLGLLDTESHIETGVLPLMERLRGCLRLLYSRNHKLRSDAAVRLIWFLAHEPDSLGKLPAISDIDVVHLSSLTMVDSPRQLTVGESSRFVFKADDVKKVYAIFESTTIEASVRLSAAERLAAMIQEDVNLHLVFLQLGGCDKILELMHAATLKTCDPNEISSKLVNSALSVLCSLLQHNSSLRHTLAHRPNSYYMLLRVGCLHRGDEDCKRRVAECLTFLLFDESASTQMWSDDGEEERKACYSLPTSVTKNYKLAFACVEHHAVSPSRVAMNSDLFDSGPLAQRLRLAWNAAWYKSIDEAIEIGKDSESSHAQLFSASLCLTDVDQSVLEAGFLPHALAQCVRDIENATLHAAVTKATLRLALYLVGSGRHCTMSMLKELQWKEAIQRFLLTVPSSRADEQLLARLLQLLCIVLRMPSDPELTSDSTSTSDPTTDDLVQWLTDMLYRPNGALLMLTARTEGTTDEMSDVSGRTRELNGQLLQFLQTFVGSCPYVLNQSRKNSEFVHADLTKHLLAKINRTDASHFYNLASLEHTLLCMMHTTARRGWSLGGGDVDCLTICLQTLHSLFEVVSAFHVGRGGISLSYMGRGVTKCATISLRHLASEMSCQLQSKDWPRNWLFSRQAMPDSSGESGLHWLFPLWTYRDPEVRAAGVGIAVALTTTESGRITMTTHCQHVPGGIWGAAFSILLDQTECSLVRQQAALLLVNLTSQPLPNGHAESTPNVWQGPLVRNEQTQMSLVGLPALLALLHHSEFYQQMAVLLSCYYSDSCLPHVSASVSLSSLQSHDTLTTSASGSLATSLAFTDVSTPSSQLMTSTPATDHSVSRRPSTEGHHGDARVVTQQIDTRGQAEQAAVQIVASQNTLTTETPASAIGGVASVSTTSSDSGDDCIATPCLIAAVCQLLGNLVSLSGPDALQCIMRHRIHQQLIGLLNAQLLDSHVATLRATVPLQRRPLVLGLQALLQMHVAVLRLLRRCAIENATLRSALMEDSAAMKRVISLLAVSLCDDEDTASLCVSLWEAVLMLFSAILRVDGQVALQAFAPVFVKQWSIIAGRLLETLQESTDSDNSFCITSLQFIALLFGEEAKRQFSSSQRTDEAKSITARLNTPSKSDDIFNRVSSGALLSRALLRVFDAVLPRPIAQFHSQKAAAFGALKCLLAISHTAKTAALEAGLVETICEHVRHLHAKLNMQTLDLSNRTTAGKNKESPLILEIVYSLDLLRSFMVENNEVKVVAYECGLANLVHKLWAWCQLDENLMSAALALLATFTARCAKAASSMVMTCAQSVEDKPATRGQQQQLSSNSLLHCLLRALRRWCGASGCTALLRGAFALVSTLALSAECRGVLWKSNFLQEFTKLCPTKSKKSGMSRVIESLWLDLLVNLSFSTEGQIMILKIEGSMPLLLDFGTSSPAARCRKSAILVLRNLCFHSANKNKLLANDQLIPFLLHSTRLTNPEIRAIACSAFWALAYNSHKAKVSLKSVHVISGLRDVYSELRNGVGRGDDDDVDWDEQSSRSLHNVLITLQASG